MCPSETSAAQVGQQWAPFSQQARFVVKHTFLDFSTSEGDEISRIKRANSDGALCEQGKDMCASSDDGGMVGEGDGDDITLCGLSECETHEAEERLSEFDDPSADVSGEEAEEPSVCVYQKQLDDLARENARLAKENSSLKTQVPTSDGESSNPSRDVEVCSHPVVLPSQLPYVYHPAMWQAPFGMPQPQGMGGWWFPAMMPNQMTTVMQNNNQNQSLVQEPQMKDTQGPRRSRRSRAARAVAPVKLHTQEESPVIPALWTVFCQILSHQCRSWLMESSGQLSCSETCRTTILARCCWSCLMPKALQVNMISCTFQWISSPVLHSDMHSSISQAVMQQHLSGTLSMVTRIGQSQAEK